MTFAASPGVAVGLPASPTSREQVAARKGWKESVDAGTAARATLQRVVAAIAPDEAKGAAQNRLTSRMPVDLSAVALQVPAERLLVNLMVEGRLAWFSWMNPPRFKPKLVVEWIVEGRSHTKTWQHGVDGSEWPQAIRLTSAKSRATR